MEEKKRQNIKEKRFIVPKIIPQKPISFCKVIWT